MQICQHSAYFGLSYNVSDCLDYSHLGPSFHSFIMVVTIALLEPVSFHQVVQFPKWKVTMDRD